MGDGDVRGRQRCVDARATLGWVVVSEHDDGASSCVTVGVAGAHDSRCHYSKHTPVPDLVLGLDPACVGPRLPEMVGTCQWGD